MDGLIQPTVTPYMMRLVPLHLSQLGLELRLGLGLSLVPHYHLSHRIHVRIYVETHYFQATIIASSSSSQRICVKESQSKVQGPG